MREMTFNVPPINLLKNSVKLLLHMCFREGRNEMVLVASNFYDSSLDSYIISEPQQVTDDENHFWLQQGVTLSNCLKVCLISSWSAVSLQSVIQFGHHTVGA